MSEFSAFEASFVGALLGAIFRLMPEILRFIDGVLDRLHEAKMLKLEMEFAKSGHTRGMRSPVPGDAGELELLLRANEQQSRISKAAGWFVERVNALVRPGVTFWLVALYSAMMLMYTKAWGPEDYMVLTSVLSFYFMNRVYKNFR